MYHMENKIVSYCRTGKSIFSRLKKRSLVGNIKKIYQLVKDEELVDSIKGQKKKITEKKIDIAENDKNKVWAFCAGQYSNDFRGNPKYLFIYINKYRPDITAYWLCEDIRIIEQVQSMGYRAYQLGTVAAEKAMNQTGVFVSEQVKAFIPRGLENAKYLNLWHGVGGVKAVERSLTEGVLAYELAKKYIQRNEYFLNNELYLAPSKFIEKIAEEQLGITPDKIVRAGYPRNIYQKNYERISTFTFDVLKEKNLPSDTRIIAYAPTYRNYQEGELFSQAIPDMQKLIEVCEKNHLLMIFKMHPLIEKEMSFLQSKEVYKDCPWLYFWDNTEDFYEVMDQVDLCIMDYSSIFTDFVACGTKHYIRYIFDIDPDTLDFPLGYDEATLGKKCKTYDELLAALEDYSSEDLTKDIERINHLYWEYDVKNSMDVIIDTTVNLKLEKVALPTLYSFDIFDTLISRKGLEPESIFYKVKEKLECVKEEYPKYLVNNFPEIRKSCELNCREYYNRSKVERDDERCEIQFEHIYRRMQTLYGITDAQMEQLMQWEVEAELEDTIPLPKQVDYVKELLAKGEKVILISDMYLPKEVIQKMLYKADPVLADLPLFLSSEYGYQKSAKSLYLEVYKSFKPYYYFGRWIHHGDNARSDGSIPETLKINTVKIKGLTFNTFEKALVEKIGTYDSYLVAAKMTRFRDEHPMSKDEFVYSYISLLFVPYVYWAIHDAIASGDEIVYFVARDGHHLKRIADAIIETEKLPIETKYIYASRRVWRIPSFIDHIDVGFWGQGYGNFGKLSSYDKMLKALDMEEKDFRHIFPELSEMNEDTQFDQKFLLQLVDIFKGSEKYREYLLAKAAEERVPVCGYLEQEIDQNRQFSIIEYWGRGYTQENFTRLWQQVVKKDVPSTFYYSRSTLPSDQYNIRKNFTCNPNAQQFIEAIFANMPYRSLENYEYQDGKWVPVIKPLKCEEELFERMQQYLPQFAKDFCEIATSDRISLGRELINFAISFYWESQDYDLFTENLAHLVDSVELYGNKLEYAKALDEQDLELIKNKVPRNKISKSIPMSFARASEDVKKSFMDRFQLRYGEDPRYGTWLTDGEIKQNKEFAKNKEIYQNKCLEFQNIYNQACKEISVTNKVLFLYKGEEFNQVSFLKIAEILESEDQFEVRKISISKMENQDEKLANALAEARFILIEKTMPKIGSLKLREETKLILLSETTCFFQPTGLIKPYKLREERELHACQEKMDIKVLPVPSDAMQDIYKKIYSVDILTDYTVKGNCVTDCYFDDKFKERMKQRLWDIFPEARGKKVICYVPKNRMREKRANYAELLDLAYLKEHLGDEYVILVNTEDNKIANTVNIAGFAKRLTKRMSIRGQFAVADIIIGDYRDIVFEAILTNKPVFLTSKDYPVTGFRKNNLFRYEEFAKGRVIADAAELVDAIQNIDSYDFAGYHGFKQKYLTYCDGKSSERLYNYMLNNKLDK